MSADPAMEFCGPCDESAGIKAFRNDVEAEGQRCMVYKRHRPMHPGRFLAFARRRFGPLEGDARAAKGGGRFAKCGRRRRPEEGGPDGGGPDAGAAASLLQTEASPGAAARCPIVMGSGCVWFVGSDDRQADWHFNVGGPGEKDWHSLLCGSEWPEASEKEGGEAGSRRVELKFALRPAAEDLDEASVYAVETSLRAELEACLLTRTEAESLDGGEQALDGLAEWEAMRNMALPTTESSMSLRILDAMVGVVGAIPGMGRASALSEALATRALGALGVVPGSHGREPEQE